ncbi:MAG TPA: hypothetical protein EYM64_00875 [Phycisphaerales bacterium]|nr:hypothetical protein [Phycisphaerales bacterium]
MKFNQLILPFVLVCGGCSSLQKPPTHLTDIGIDVHSDVAVVDPRTGGDIGWAWMLDQISTADVVLLGEQHDHAVGHAVQLAIVEDVLDQFPDSVVAFEMFERDEQHRVDDYMDGVIDAKTLATLTHSTNWGARGGWAAWYQPILDAVKDRKGVVIAANAPRRYVKLVRTDGFDRIDSLPKERRRLVDYPTELSSGRYRERFWELSAHGEEDGQQKDIDVSTLSPDDPLLPMFRSQQTWDATMAQSIVDAKPSNSRKVLLLVGQFHVEYNGGIIQELRRRMPIARVLVISIQREIPEEDWQGTPPIADVMVVENPKK